MHILVVRHGQPVDEAETGGEGDPALSPLGHAQARAIGDFLANEQVDHIVASPMVRAFQTSLPLSERLGLEPQLDDRLKEAGWQAGPYMRSEENLDFFIERMDRDPDFIFKPETKATFFERVNASFADIAAANPGKNVAVFCHGMVTSALTCMVTKSDDHMGFRPDYTGLTRVQASSSGEHWTLRSFNEHSHLRTIGD